MFEWLVLPLQFAYAIASLSLAFLLAPYPIRTFVYPWTKEWDMDALLPKPTRSRDMLRARGDG